MRGIPNGHPLLYYDGLWGLVTDLELLGDEVGQLPLGDDIDHHDRDIRPLRREVLHLDEGTAADATTGTVFVDDDRLGLEKFAELFLFFDGFDAHLEPNQSLRGLAGQLRLDHGFDPAHQLGPLDLVGLRDRDEVLDEK